MTIVRKSKGAHTAYTREGTDKVIHRGKTGPTKKQIRDLPQFERTRQNNIEFTACTRMTTGIRTVLFPLKHLCGSFLIGGLNGLAKKIQKLDEAGERGRRSVYLSRAKYLLAGFSLTKNHSFDSIVGHPIAVKTTGKKAAATVTIPPLAPGVSLSIPWKAPYFRFVLVLGAVEDVVCTKNGYDFPDAGGLHYTHTGWCHTSAPSGEQTVALKLPDAAGDNTSLVLAMGIELGGPDCYGEISPLPKAGAARILAVF